ncbi:MAG: hypothetical protein U9Q82_14045 [Chloroflexota bacterium]|nr:hypothetical protein [Chloroflexota bacterium]
MKNLKRSSKYVFILILVVILVLLILGFNNRIAELEHLSGQVGRVEIQVTRLQQTQDLLETQIAYATSDAYVDDWAYKYAHWIREGDYLMVPLSDTESTPVTIQDVSETSTQTLYNWQVWKALFFDENLP